MERPSGRQEFFVFLAVAAEEEIDQERDIVFALAKGGKIQINNIEAVVEIFAEFAVFDQLLEIGVGGGDDADVDAHAFVGAQRHEFAVLKNAQKLDLNFGADGADFVEENAAAIRSFEEAFAIGDGSGEGAFDMAEQECFREVRRAANRC